MTKLCFSFRCVYHTDRNKFTKYTKKKNDSFVAYLWTYKKFGVCLDVRPSKRHFRSWDKCLKDVKEKLFAIFFKYLNMFVVFCLCTIYKKRFNIIDPCISITICISYHVSINILKNVVNSIIGFMFFIKYQI